jgi:hypothetical protein
MASRDLKRDRCAKNIDKNVGRTCNYLGNFVCTPLISASQWRDYLSEHETFGLITHM